MGKRRVWTEEELTKALELYHSIPFGQCHSRNKQIIRLADDLGRTPSAVSLKLCNFARLDPVHQRRGVKGMQHGNKLEEKIWNQFK